MNQQTILCNGEKESSSPVNAGVWLLSELLLTTVFCYIKCTQQHIEKKNSLIPSPFKTSEKGPCHTCTVQTKLPGILMNPQTIWIGSLGPWSVLLSSINYKYHPFYPLPPPHDTSHSSQTIVTVWKWKFLLSSIADITTQKMTIFIAHSGCLGTR